MPRCAQTSTDRTHLDPVHDLVVSWKAVPVKALVSALLLSTLAAVPIAHADPLPIVAVFDLKDNSGKAKNIIGSLTDYLRIKIAETRTMRVVDKTQQESELRALIQAQKKDSYKECYDESCQIPLGKELAADKILRGTISKVGKIYILSVELIDLATNTTAGAASVKSGGSEEDLLEAVEKVAEKITNSERGAARNLAAKVEPVKQVVADVAPPVEAPRVAERRAFVAIGSAVKQVVRDGQDVYVLKTNENVELLKPDGSWEQFDSGSGTKMIAADKGYCYVLKTDGNLWRRSRSSAWVKIDAGTGTKQVLAAAGRVFVLKNEGQVYQYAGDTWKQVDSGTGTQMIAGDDLGNLYVLKDNGNIWRSTDLSSWNKIDEGTGTKQIAAYNGTVYALKTEGNVHKYDGQWTKIDNGTGTKMIAVDRHLVYVLKTSGQIWLHENGGWNQLDKAPGTTSMFAHSGMLYAIASDYASTVYRAAIQ